MSESEPSSSAFRDAFLNQERAARDVVLVRRIFIVMAGSIADGTLLSQIVYWYLPDKSGRSKLRVNRRGHMWIAKQHKEWYEEICMTERQAKTTTKRLSAKGLILTAGMLFNGKRTTHIRIDWDEFEKQYQRAKSYLLTHKVPNWSDP